MQAYLDAAGGIGADDDRVTENELPPARAEKPFNPIRTPQRDERFTRVWHSRGRGPDADISASERNWYQLFIRLTEMHVPELMALIIYDWDDQPWAFYHDMARQLWDEARHAMMGEIAFEEWIGLGGGSARNKLWRVSQYPTRARGPALPSVGDRTGADETGRETT